MSSSAFNLYHSKEPFEVYQYDETVARQVGFGYAFVYSGELFMMGLNDDERFLNDGRFTNFVADLQLHDFSLDVPNLVNIEKYIEAANQCDRPWTFRLVQLPKRNRNRLRITFSVMNEVHALEMKMRWF